MQGRQQKKKRYMMTTNNIGQERQHLTAVWRNGGCSASYDSFVVGSSAVLRMNICGKNPPLRQAAKR
jgi:ribonucleotide monophosphatase NagD (HAD superfamily)